jgi:hypothetical protein
MKLEEVGMQRQLPLTLGLALLWVLAAGWPLPATQQAQESQNPPPPREMPGPGGRAFGTIVSVGVDRLEISKPDGSKQTVLVDAQTNFREGRQQEIQLEDLKPGDRIMALGRTNENKDFVARLVRRVTDEEMARMPRPGEVAFGEIVAIDKDQLKVRNPMQGERVVVVNEQTTFMKEGQTITLKDLKVGDRILAIGKETNGQFVAVRVATGQFQRGGGQFRPRVEGGPDQP